MLPTNFDTLAVERPELKSALRAIREWISDHPDWNVIDPRELARSLPSIGSFALASALHFLVTRGLFRQVYVVVTPSGVLSDNEFEDPRAIPERLPDRFNNYFETAEADIVPVLTAKR